MPSEKIKDIKNRDNSYKGDLKRKRYDETDKLARTKLMVQIALLSLLTTKNGEANKKGIAFILVIIVILIMSITNPELLKPLIESLVGLISI